MIKKSNRISPADAAKEIGCHVEYLRRQMRRTDENRWDLGEVVPPETPGGDYQYFIFRGKLDKFLGRESNILQYETYSEIRCRNTGFSFRAGDTIKVSLKTGEQISDCMIVAINAEGFMYRNDDKKSGIIKYCDVAEIEHYLGGKEVVEGA